MAFLPLNLFFAGLFLFTIAWGWDGQEARQLMGVFASIFMFPLWLLPLYNLIDGTSIVTIKGWLPTGILENLLIWNVVLMLFTAEHLMETLNREDPLGRAMKRLRKKA